MPDPSVSQNVGPTDTTAAVWSWYLADPIRAAWLAYYGGWLAPPEPPVGASGESTGSVG